MKDKPFKIWQAGSYVCVLGVLIVAAGCTKASLQNLPFLRSAMKADESFGELAAKSESVSLTIWHDSFDSALQASRESGKPILADFTGSDWCTWCIKLKEDVFETEEFKSWAHENVILLELDYPKRSMQSMEIRNQNKELAKRYEISGYPTVLLIDSEGEVLGKLGYMKDPVAWINTAQPMLRNPIDGSQFQQGFDRTARR